MKKIIWLILIILLVTLHSQIGWQENGIPVRQGVNIEWSRTGQKLSDGTIVYGWSDTRRGDRDIWGQKIDENGNYLWGEDGILINGEINRQEDIVAIDAGSDVIFAWVDFRHEDAGDIYAQKLDSNGNLLWDPIGVPLCLAEDIQISINIINDANGGAYIIWLDSRNPGGTDIYGTHILSDGTIAAGWEEDGKPIIDESGHQNQHTFWEDGTGGAILAWHDDRNADDENIYIQRITENGSLLWGATGTLLCNDPGTQEKPKVAPDGTGGFIFTWRDKRNENSGDIYAQRIDLNGNLMWDNEIGVFVGDGIQENARITSSSDNGAIIVWEDGRNNNFYKDIYAQKIDLNGNLVWGADCTPVCVSGDDQLNPRLTNDGNGGAWIIWDDARGDGYPHVDIYVQHLDSSGNSQLSENGQIVCSATSEQFAPLIKKISDNLLVTWGDNRTGSTGFYLQVLNSSGQEQLAENGEIVYYGLSGDANNYQLLENGDNPVLIWEDTRNASIAIQIFMQTINGDGTFGLIKNGHPITAMTGYDQENKDAVYKPGSNVLGVVWQENRIGYNQIYAQGVNLQADHLWSDTGFLVGDYLSEQQAPKISIKESGGTDEYYIGWHDFRADYTFGIYGQKIVDGEVQWDAAGKVIVDSDRNDELLDLVENYYIWKSGTFNDQNIYVKLVDENGNTAPSWPDSGLVVCDAPLNQGNAKGILIPDGLLIIWSDLRSGDLDIYGQVITADGTTLWQDNGVPLASQLNEQVASNIIYDDEIYMIWQDFRTGIANDAYMQKYDSNGDELWQENGLEIAVQDSSQVDPYLASDGTRFLAFWKDTRNSQAGRPNSDIYYQHLNSDGEIQSGDPSGVLVCSAIKNQNYPRAVSNGSNTTYLIWQDTRSSGKTDIYNIYAQKFEFVAASENEIEPQDFLRMNNFPNPFRNSTLISFSVSPDLLNNSKLEIYNIKGQNIRSIIPESNEITWNGIDKNGHRVSSGIYFYKLDLDKFETKPQKMILMR